MPSLSHLFLLVAATRLLSVELTVPLHTRYLQCTVQSTGHSRVAWLALTNAASPPQYSPLPTATVCTSKPPASECRVEKNRAKPTAQPLLLPFSACYFNLKPASFHSFLDTALNPRIEAAPSPGFDNNSRSLVSLQCAFYSTIFFFFFPDSDLHRRPYVLSSSLAFFILFFKF